MEGLNTSAEWANLIMNTEENLSRKIYDNLPVGKTKDRWLNWQETEKSGDAKLRRLGREIGLPLKFDDNNNNIVRPFCSYEYCQWLLLLATSSSDRLT